MGDIDTKFVPSRMNIESMTQKEMYKEAAKALREWANPDRLFQLDERMSLVFVVAGVVWLFSTFIERGFPLITVDSIRAVYGLCVSFIWVGYKYSRIIFSLRLRMFLLAMSYQVILATAFLLPYYGMANILGLSTGVVQWPGGESNLLILATMRFLLIIPVLVLLAFVNIHLGWPRNRVSQHWNHLVRRDVEIDERILGQPEHLERLRTQLHEWAGNTIKQSEMLGLLFVAMLHIAWMAPSVGSRWLGALPMLALAFIFYIFRSHLRSEETEGITGIAESTNATLDAI